MYKIYYLVSPSTNWYYIGMTKTSLAKRLANHKSKAKSGAKSPLYSCMRKYGDFLMVVKAKFDSHKLCCEEEIKLIEEAKENNHSILNLAEGGNGGFVIPEDQINSWKEKLRNKRSGRKPALGMSHTEDNKNLFSRVSRKYWDSQPTYDAKEVSKYSCKDAKRIFGISKTHYYRLKRALSSDQC